MCVHPRPGKMKAVGTLRFRLTALYLAFFSLLFVLFSVFLYSVLATSLRSRLDETLISEANTVAVMFQDEFQEMKGDTQVAANETVAGVRFRGLVAVAEAGRLLASSAPFPPDEFQRAIARAAGDTVLDLDRAHVAVRRVTAGGRSFLILVAEPLDSIMAELRVVRRIILIGLPLMLALAGFGGYLLAARGLAPLASMALQARRITGSNLETRIRIGDAAEELTVLVTSFNELLSRLDQSFESMRRFVADASHELRTPISIIRGEAEVALSHQRTTAEYGDSLAIVLDESRRLSRLVDDLLHLARADAGKVKLRMQEFYLNDLLAECCRGAQTLAGARNLSLECSPGADAPFHGDEELLRRLLMNLLDNAIRYTPPGGKVSAALEANGVGLRLRVSDTGVGIPAEDARHVFERFYRASHSRAREDGGFGLGLAIVKWIAESHQGAVECISQPGVGSTFTVALPQLPRQPQ